MKYEDLKAGDIFYADWHGLLIYILDTNVKDYEFLLYNEDTNTIFIDHGPKEEWNDSIWVGREPIWEINRHKFQARFIDYIFTGERG